MILPLISLMVGMVLAQRFSVFIMAPGVFVTLLAAIGLGIARSESLWAIAVSAALAVASIQIGYLLGAGARYLMLVARARSLHSRSLGGALQPRRRGAH